MDRRNRTRFLIRHLGNMGDMVFFVPPILEMLKKTYPTCHITLVLPWGFKDRKKKLRNWKLRNYDVWERRNQSGFSIHLMMTNPYIDRLVHWHDTRLDLEGTLCKEDGKSFPTWSASYYEKEKRSQKYDAVYELDFGLKITDNPIQRMYEYIGLPEKTYSNYKLYLTDSDKEVASRVMKDYPRPRIVLLEGIESRTTRGWDPEKVKKLKIEIRKMYGVDPIHFGSYAVPMYQGRYLMLRENIATLTCCDVGIGVMSGPIHFASSVGLPTITLYGDQPMHRAAPAYFLNEYIQEEKKKHRTILGATNNNKMRFLKDESTLINLSSNELPDQKYKNWLNPGKQSSKSCISVITVDEVMTVLKDMV